MGLNRLNSSSRLNRSSRSIQKLRSLRPSKLHDETTEGVHRKGVARLHYRSGGSLLDNGRPVDDVPLKQLGPIEDRGLNRSVSLENHRASPALSRARRSELTLRKLREMRLAQASNRRHAQAHHVRRLLGSAVTVA